jgi:hypothetical protein
MFNNFYPKILPFFGQCGKNMLRRRQATGAIIWRMRTACWITKATDKHSDYVTLIAFLQQQSLGESAPIHT